ncbi:hypothetical protein KKH13_04790 [Patescibacteria group bacterium]|nr:hypothetical protein [Patescibacteria group bacterium]
MQLIILMDIAGYTGNAISAELGMTPSRISIIRNAPIYTEAKRIKEAELSSKVIEKRSNSIAAGDPIEARLKLLAVDAVEKYAVLLKGANSEFVQKSTADSILDRAGYKARSDKTIISVEITEKMATRFEKVLSRAVMTEQEDDVRPSQNERETTISIKKTVSA